jgi:hypothetical protein
MNRSIAPLPEQSQRGPASGSGICQHNSVYPYESKQHPECQKQSAKIRFIFQERRHPPGGRTKFFGGARLCLQDQPQRLETLSANGFTRVLGVILRTHPRSEEFCHAPRAGI